MTEVNDAVERLFSLLYQKGRIDKDMARDLNIPQSTIASWKRNGRVPKYDQLKKIADYLEVSVDYLLTGTESQYVQMNNTDVLTSDKEKEIIRMYRSLPDNKQHMVLAYLQGLSARDL